MKAAAWQFAKLFCQISNPTVKWKFFRASLINETYRLFTRFVINSWLAFSHKEVIDNAYSIGHLNPNSFQSNFQTI